MSTIVDIRGRQILDSRGNPTVEVDVTLCRRHDRHRRRAQRGEHRRPRGQRAPRRRQGQVAGQGRRRRPSTNVNDVIADELIGMDALDQIAVDQRMIELDGTPNKKKLGANAILGVSLATAHAAAPLLRAAAVPLPRRLERQPAAGADDEHPQRRPACRQQRRRAGVHGHAAGLRQLQRRPALRLRDVPQPQEGAARQEAEHGRGRRGRLRPRPGGQRRRVRRDPHRPSRRPATSRASRCGSPWTWRAPSSTTPRRRSTRSTARRSTRPRMVDLLAELGREVPDLLDRRRLRRGRLGRLEAC